MFDLSGDTPKRKLNNDPFGIMPKELTIPMIGAKPVPKPIPTLTLPSHNPFVPEPQSNLGAAWHSGVTNSAIGKLALTPAAKFLGPEAQEKLKELQSYQPQTLGEKATSFLTTNLTDAPLWMAGEAVAGKLLSPLAKTKPIANVASKLPKPLAPIIGGGIKDAAAYGSVVAPAETIASGDGLKGLLEREKQLPAMALGGMALRGAFTGAGKAFDSVRPINLPELKSNPLEDVRNAYKQTKPIAPPEPKQWTNADQIKARSNQFNPFDVPKLEKKVEAIPPQVGKEVKQAEKKLEQTAKQVGVDYTKIKDITGFEGQTKDVYRILEKTMGKEFADNFMKSFDSSKGSYVDMQNQILTGMKKSIVEGLGIKKGSKESELVQKYGEKLIGEEELKKLSPDKWQNIVRADMWFRETYDKLIDQINDVKRQIYPNAEARIAEIEGKLKDVRTDKSLTAAEKQGQVTMLEDALETAMRGKFIPKRSDYYRHFQELSEGLSGLKNIFDNPVNIDPTLVGKTQFTKPKSKWASIAQKRLGGKTEYDAVGGFLNYLPQAAYAVHIDPQISRFRGLADEIAEGTKDTRNANNLIEFLQDFSNDLSGKTNSLDRYIQKVIPGGRTTIKAMDWLQNRIKSNMILGNFGSAVSQVANIPNGIAFAKQHSATGAAKTMRTLFNPSEEMKQSNFLKERWGGVGSKVYRQFDESLLKKPKEAATWLLETADKVGTQFVWNSAYSKGVAEKVANPIQYADDATRKLIAGRGIGEVPLVFKSKSFGWVAPFQLEVGNLWHVQKDMLDKKDLTGLAVLYTSMFMFNQLSEEVKGFGVTFDPIQAVIDASEEGLTPIERGGRIAGEIVSNIPLGQTLAKSLVPEYGGELPTPWGKTYDLPSRKELFGENDPTRFGSGVLAFDALKSPENMAKSLLLPFGGSQVLKTYKGLDALMDKGVYSGDGKQLNYPVGATPSNLIKGTLFGTSGFPESKEYYSKNRRPLSEKQTEKAKSAADLKAAYEAFMKQRELERLKNSK